MTFSSLISGTIPHHGKYNARGTRVTRVIQHHWADTGMGGQAALASPNTKKSVTYVVHNDGVILGQVPEEYRPWTSGGAAADNPSITIEVQNETAGPEWRVSAAAVNSITRLIADIAKRHGFGSLNENNYTGHRKFAATACPGPYLWPRLIDIRASANALLIGSPVPIPPPASGGEPQLVIDGSRGPKTISRWQSVMGTPADGVISSPSSVIKADQIFLNSVVASSHIKNLTGNPALTVDGYEGSHTVIVRQFWMHNVVGEQHQINLIGHKLAFDGHLGPETNKVHQFSLNNTTAGSKKYGQVP